MQLDWLRTKSGSHDILIVDADPTPRTVEETKKKARVAPDDLIARPAKSAKQGQGKAAAKSTGGGADKKKKKTSRAKGGRLADLPKLIKIGGADFELKWIGRGYDSAEKLVSAQHETQTQHRRRLHYSRLSQMIAHGNLTSQAVRVIELHASGHKLCEEIDKVLRGEGFTNSERRSRGSNTMRACSCLDPELLSDRVAFLPPVHSQRRAVAPQ